VASLITVIATLKHIYTHACNISTKRRPHLPFMCLNVSESDEAFPHAQMCPGKASSFRHPPDGQLLIMVDLTSAEHTFRIGSHPAVGHRLRWVSRTSDNGR
jgi:hypothetical protein